MEEKERQRFADNLGALLSRKIGPLMGRSSVKAVIASLSRMTGIPVSAISEGPTAVVVAMSVTPKQLAIMVDLRYSDGASHEDVTAWLEEATAGRFREVLCEVESWSDGSAVLKRWMLAPKMITVTMELGPEAPHD